MRVDEISVTISQEADCCQNQDEYQSMEISFPNNGVDNFIAIKTDRWSFSDVGEIKRFCDFIERMQNECGKEYSFDKPN